MTRLVSRACIAVVVLALGSPTARAEDQLDDEPHYFVPAAWSLAEFLIPAFYYDSTPDEQRVDWTHPSWTDKLTLRAFRFDTNALYINAIRHPLIGMGDYQIARSNGFGMWRSTLYAYVSGLIWEVGVEYKEYPSINDVIMNGAGALGIAEPLYQIAQIWRSESPSVLDRIRTASMSPWDASQDLWRHHRWRARPYTADFIVTAGVVQHQLIGESRNELIAGVDFDVVRHAQLPEQGAHGEPIEPGAWSRFVLSFTQPTGGTRFSSLLRSRSSLVGHFDQDDAGNGSLVALAAGFTYRRDTLANETDHLALGQLVGPQLQLIRRGDVLVRFDLAAYADFGMVDAHVFKPVSPLPPAPPLLTPLQAQGYYDGAGASLEARVRADHGPWRADVEVTGHQLWSLDFADRGYYPSTRSTSTIPATPHGVSDMRIYGHATLGWHGERWGVAGVLDSAYRHGVWADLERTTTDWRGGLEVTADL